MSSQYDCLFNSLLWLTTKKTSNVPVTGPLWRESTSDWWISHTKTSLLRKVFHAVTSPRRNENSNKWLILRETSRRNDIKKLLAIECVIIDIMSMSNKMSILFLDIKRLIRWSLFVLNSVFCSNNGERVTDSYHHSYWYCWLTIPTHCGRNKMAAILQTFWTSFLYENCCNFIQISLKSIWYSRHHWFR